MISEIEPALDLGEFIPYNRSWDFVQTLETVKLKIDALVKKGDAERAVSLYEIFLSGCYEKADEIDDSGGNLGMFFENLFCVWINVRQKAKYDSAETVQHILKWMDNDTRKTTGTEDGEPDIVWLFPSCRPQEDYYIFRAELNGKKVGEANCKLGIRDENEPVVHIVTNVSP